MSAFTVHALVLCDDVRREVSQKDILIGAYGSELVVSSLPTQSLMAVWMEVEFQNAGEVSFSLRIEPPNKGNRVNMTFTMQVEYAEIPSAIFTPQFPCVIDSEGELRIFAKINDQSKFSLIKRKRVRCQPGPDRVF